MSFSYVHYYALAPNVILLVIMFVCMVKDKKKIE